MKLSKLLLGLIFLFAIPTFAQAHSVSLGWTKSTDDTGVTGQGYTIYRMSGSCPTTAPTTTTGFTALNTALLAAGTVAYTDTTVIPGTYCYLATFTAASAVSGVSNDAAATILPAAPTGVKVSSSN